MQVFLVLDTESGQAGQAQGRGEPVPAAAGRRHAGSRGGPPAAAQRALRPPHGAAAPEAQGRPGGGAAGCSALTAQRLPAHRGEALLWLGDSGRRHAGLPVRSMWMAAVPHSHKGHALHIVLCSLCFFHAIVAALKTLEVREVQIWHSVYREPAPVQDFTSSLSLYLHSPAEMHVARCARVPVSINTVHGA